MRKTLFLAVFGLILSSFSPFWGFFAHEKINRLAVFALPPDMIGFYKANIAYIAKASTNPDRRRYVVEEEGPRHFLDMDHYGDSALAALPRGWEEAEKLYGRDTLEAHGVLPWHIVRMHRRLEDAFLLRNAEEILKTSAELGHYLADAHVPLHTTENYNGQLTGQEGIHGFWESRLPEMFSSEYDFFVGRAAYITDPRAAAWQIIANAHAAVKTVLGEEKKLADRYGEKKYSFETRGNATVKVYAAEYASDYHRALDGMVEQQMRASVKAIGDFWYTAWVNAGQPDLRKLIHFKPTGDEVRQKAEEVAKWKAARRRPRDHE